MADHSPRSTLIRQQGRLKEIAAAAQNLPVAEVPAAQQERPEKSYASTIPTLDLQAHSTAISVAAQAVNTSLQAQRRAIDMINMGQLGSLIHRAMNLASTPHTRELLRRTDEVSSAGTAIVEGRELSVDDMPEPPQLEWVFELDRATLLFLCRLLFHLTAILSPAFGVAISISDREIDAEDWSPILAGLNVTLAYVLIALQKKDND